jgi:uncharacterized membrane protein
MSGRKVHPIVAFFGFVLTTVGLLALVASGSCTAMGVVGSLGSGNVVAILMVLVIGGVPALLAYLLMRLGMRMVNPPDPSPNAPPSLADAFRVRAPIPDAQPRYDADRPAASESAPNAPNRDP